MSVSYHMNLFNKFITLIRLIVFNYIVIKIYNQDKLCDLHLLNNINYYFAIKVFFFGLFYYIVNKYITKKSCMTYTCLIILITILQLKFSFFWFIFNAIVK